MTTKQDTFFDLIIIGAGAAGLTAAIFAGEHLYNTSAKVLLLETAKKPGAKILVSGGGRCNVTHRTISPDDYAGGSSHVIRRVLKAFDENRTLEWMKELGVELKLENTGKYFPVTDKARTVLDALLKRVSSLNVQLRTGSRVTHISGGAESDYRVYLDGGEAFSCKCLVVATGGLALPKSGSDGKGLEWMRKLGHTVNATTPSLVPLVYQAEEEERVQELKGLSGLSSDLRLSLYEQNKLVKEFTDSTLFTHFGLSGPAAMNLSRFFNQKLLTTPLSELSIYAGSPELKNVEDADRWLLEKTRNHPKQTVRTALCSLFPDRLSKVFAGRCLETQLSNLKKEQRRELATTIVYLKLPVMGDRGYTFAETTAGGIDLSEVNPATFESRKVSKLYLCGEILDVDGRIGGFNFQWAWATGYLAGVAAAKTILKSDS